MKKLLLSIIFIGILSISTMEAQTPDFKTGVSFKALFMDYQSMNGGDISDFKSYKSGFELGFHYNLAKHLNLNVPFKIGVVQSHQAGESVQKTLFGGDLQIQYHFIDDANTFNPYLLAGIGGVMEDDGEFNIQAPVGVGLNIRVAQNSFINFQSEYRKSFKDDRDNLHHGIGFVYLFGKPKAQAEEEPEMPEEEQKPDSDGDGLIDEVDLCPQQSGPAELSGCPDSDEDGVADYEDECPETSGDPEMNGCPDTDGDGIADINDECPNMAGDPAKNGCPNNDRDDDGIPNDVDRCPDLPGPAANFGCPTLDSDEDGITDDKDRCPNSKGTEAADGCPDADGDGIADFEDKCPNSPGNSVYGGCPDTDGDGIDDSRDRCPNTPGSVDRNGCPEIAAADREILVLAMRAVQFDTGRSTLKSESHQILDQIVGILEKYPDFSMTISGHTDNTGSARTNQILSERRAESCYDYLISKGITASRLAYQGFGQTRPIASNNSLSGRALNRRVEFNMEGN